jgi:carbon starvation protein CstA
MGDYTFPSMTLENLHPDGTEFFPDMFITVACGAISGFHATQSPMVARCITDEKDGRMIFYGAMVIESMIALIWALAGLTFYGDTSALAAALADGGSAGVVYDIAVGVAGPVGSVLAVLGVIVCPITTGDTALRSARLMVQDDRGIDNSDMKSSLIITGALMVVIIAFTTFDFSVLWNYFSWINQTLACIVLWTATAFLLKTMQNKLYSLLTAAPALFMVLVTTSFFFHSKQFLGLDHSISLMLAALIGAAALITYLWAFNKARKNSE